MSNQSNYSGSEITTALRYCELALPQVSRTFAINIRVLEGELYRAVLAAYLFCRLVDTVEDSSAMSLELQTQLLSEYARLFQTTEIDLEAIGRWKSRWGVLDSGDPEQDLVANCEQVFQLFADLSPSYRQAICDCVREMAEGMRSTLLETSPDSDDIRSLKGIAELERYCYYVAGTVGKMLTRLFVENLPDFEMSRRERLDKLDVSFALGLQLTNIIKDCATDIERGWCYLPRDLLAEAGVSPATLLDPAHNAAVQQVLNQLILKTAAHLEDALEYTLTIPASSPKIRLFNLWSLFFAIRTLALAWDNRDVLDPGQSVKIPRLEVYRTIAETRIAVKSDESLRRLFATIRSRIPSTCDAPL